MVNENINLNWKGPFPFEKFSNKEICNSNPDLNENGVYLYSLKEKNSDIYMVTYVGAAPIQSIFNRIFNEYSGTKNLKIGSYLKHSISDTNEELEIFIRIFDEIDEDLIKHNIESHFIFYAVPDNDIISKLSQELSDPFKEIEGALKNILRRKMESRKFLNILEHPKYNFNPKFIINSTEDPVIKIKGLI